MRSCYVLSYTSEIHAGSLRPEEALQRHRRPRVPPPAGPWTGSGGVPQPGSRCSESKAGFVYILANRRFGTLYVGVTSDLARRVWEHRTGAVDGFTKRHGLRTLVWYEAHDGIREAIAREKAIKHWCRARKIRRIEAMNPDWRDLYPDLNR